MLDTGEGLLQEAAQSFSQCSSAVRHTAMSMNGTSNIAVARQRAYGIHTVAPLDICSAWSGHPSLAVAGGPQAASGNGEMMYWTEVPTGLGLRGSECKDSDNATSLQVLLCLPWLPPLLWTLQH